MQNKFDQINPAISQSEEPQEFVVGEVASQMPISILELFKKRLDNWTQTDVSPFVKKYELSQLLNQYLTLNDLNRSIRSLDELVDILKHPKMSIENRYLLVHALVAVFSPVVRPNQVPNSYCNDPFMALLIKNKNDFYTLMNLITEYPAKQYSIQFQQWLMSTSSYIKNLMTVNYGMAPPVSFFIAPNNNFQPMPVYLNQQRHLPAQQVQGPVNQIQSPPQDVNTALNTFIGRVKLIDKNKMKAHKNFEHVLFDEQLTAEQVKSSIHNVKDLIRIFDECNLTRDPCYALVNYFISKLPLKDNNGNLRAHPCDEDFLQKIIHKKEDVDSICGYLSHTTRNYHTIFTNRLNHCSTHGRKVLAGQVILPQNNTSSLGFFAPDIQSNVALPPKQSAKPAVLINLIEEENLEPVERKASEVRERTETLEPRAEKRAKNNVGEAIERRKIDDSEHPLGRLSIYFNQRNNAPQVVENVPPQQVDEPEGGEYDYYTDAEGNMRPIL